MEPKEKQGENEMCSVSYALGGTIAKANFENIKFNIGLTIPCGIKDISKALKEVQSLVEKEYGKKMKEYRG